MIAVISRTFNTAATIKSEKMMKQMLHSGPREYINGVVEFNISVSASADYS